LRLITLDLFLKKGYEDNVTPLLPRNPQVHCISPSRTCYYIIAMYERLFHKFAKGSRSLQVYQGYRLIFESSKDRLTPLLEYIERFASHHNDVVVFDKITGNAAALLLVKANCRKVYSPLGSALAIDTLTKYGIEYHFTKTIDCIQKPDGQGMCPMEKLSLNKEPEEFYRAMKKTLASR